MTTTVQEAEAAVSAVQTKLEFIQTQEQETLGRMRNAQARLSTLLADAADEKTLRGTEDELLRLTNRVTGYAAAKRQAELDLATAEKVLADAMLAQARAALMIHDQQFTHVDNELLAHLRAAAVAFSKRSGLEWERIALVQAAGDTSPAPRLVLFKEDLGEAWLVFREWLLPALERLTLLPVRRPAASEGEGGENA